MRLINFLKDGGYSDYEENWDKIPLNNKINYIKGFLQQKGYSSNQTAAILGNLLQENDNLNTKRTNGIGATGIAQWLGDRKKQLMSKSNPHSIITQLNHLDSELKGNGWAGYKNLKNSFFNGDNIEQLTYAIRKGFERPGEHEAMDHKRVSNAYKVLGIQKPNGEQQNYDYTGSGEQSYRPSYQYSIPQEMYQNMGWDGMKKQVEQNPQILQTSNGDLQAHFEETMRLESEKFQQDMIKNQVEVENKRIENELLQKQQEKQQILSMVPQSGVVASGNINMKF